MCSKSVPNFSEVNPQLSYLANIFTHFQRDALPMRFSDFGRIVSFQRPKSGQISKYLTPPL